MHQFGRTMLRATTLLIAATSISCAADRLSSPVKSAIHAPVSDSPIQGQLVRDIANLSAMLASNEFHGDLNQGATAAIQQRRARVQGVLADFEAQLQNLPQQRPVSFDVAPAPVCLLNGNLDQCFLEWRHSIDINGTGYVFQLTGFLIGASQSAVVGYTESPRDCRRLS